MGVMQEHVACCCMASLLLPTAISVMHALTAAFTLMHGKSALTCLLAPPLQETRKPSCLASPEAEEHA